MQGSIRREGGSFYLEESGPDHTTVRYKLKEILYSKQSPFQLVEIADSHDYGRMLILDGCVNVCERDEANYHEMMAHLPALLHPEPSSILVIGGGDGGIVRELLKHPTIERIEVVEIDAEVIDSCKRFLPSLASGFNDSRVQVYTEDGVAYVREAPSSRYSIVIIDSSDPKGPAVGLFTNEFYQSCKRIIDRYGIVVAQSESPYVYPDILKLVHTQFCRIFATVLPCHVPMPTYPSGQIYLMMGTNQAMISLSTEGNRVREFLVKNQTTLRYLNEQVFNAAFSISNDVKQLLVGEM
jgi:spermidine synthase